MPDDFGTLLLHAMEYLNKNGRSNIFYNLAKGIRTMRDDDSDSIFPVKHMPFGLLEYMAKFFSCDTFQQVIFFLSCKSVLRTYIVHYWWEDVLKIFDRGKSQCMFSLVRSGAILSMVQCGVWSLQSKDRPLAAVLTQ